MVLPLVVMMVVMEVVVTFVGWTWKAGGSKGQFNIDDVGYANASDVNMNVAGLNSSLYDSSQTWSSLCQHLALFFDL